MIVLLLGGARSGKSAAAERLVDGLRPPVTYAATWTGVAGGADADADMAARVAAHRARRPAHWATVEVAGPDLIGVVAAAPGTVLVDALGTWVAGAPSFAVDGGGLCRALRQRDGDAVVVSEEVGLGVHPTSASGRAFRDALGDLNAQVATVADRAWLVVAGRVLPLDNAPW